MRLFEQKNRYASGFTIIELIVVTAIIAVLLSVISVSIVGAKAKGRDARRVSDMNELAKALSLYNNNHNRYPIQTTQILLTSSDPVSATLEGDGVISNVPKDPLSSARDYTYISDLTGNSYILTFCTETNSIPRYPQNCGVSTHSVTP